MTHEITVPPLTIQIMLAHYVSPTPSGVVGEHVYKSMAGTETANLLLDAGLIEENGEVTEKGKAWVEMICSTPLPVCKWVKP